MSSPESHGTSSLGGLHDLLDPAFDHDEGEVVRAPEKAPSSKKRLMNDDEDEDEEIDVEESSGDEYEYESPSTNNNNNNNKNHIYNKSPPMTNYSSPSRRRTRSCAVPDVLKTKEVVTLDDLMKHGFLRPGDTLEFSGLGDAIETGILVKDGWIEYGTDKYPDMDAWVIRVFKDNKRRRKNVDCWETVSARHHALSFHRDQFLNKMNNRVNYNDRKKRLREERKKTAGGKGGGAKHQVPGRSRLVHKESQQASVNHGNDDEDEEVMIDDEPSTSNAIVLPHKKRKTNYSKHVPANDEKPASSSSSVDLLGDMSGPSALLREDTELLPDAHEYIVKANEKNSSAWLGKRKKDDGNDAPSTPPPQTKPNKEKKPKKETKPSPLSRRRTETQAQQMDEDEDEDIGARTSSPQKEKEQQKKEEKEDNDETRDEDDAKENGAKDARESEDTDATRDDEDAGDNDETRDEEGEEGERDEEGEEGEREGEGEEEETHDSVAQQGMPQPPSGKQHLQHITSPSSSDSTNASSSSAEMNVWSDKSKSTYDSIDSFVARLDEHEKEVETLSTKKLSQTKTKKTPPEPTPAPSKPTPSIPPPSKSSSTSKPAVPPKASSKPTPSIPASSKPTPSSSSLPPTPSSTKSSSSLQPPKFTLPPSSESVSPIASHSIATIPTTPITPASSSTSFTTPSTARKPAQPVVFTPARPPSAQSMPVSPSAICKDGQERIILTTGLRSDMLCTLQALMAQLGGRTVDEFDDTQGARVTHVVTGLTAGDDTHRAQRTLKYCCGVLCGAWIVSFEWVLESLAAREWVEESDFELRGDTHGAGAPKKARIALRKGSQRLFTGLRICFAGDFTQPSRKDLQRVARIGGADILATLPSPTTTMPEYLAEVKHTHVVIDPERTDTAAAQELHLVCGLVPLSYHWLLDSVSHYAVQAFDKYRIVVQEEGRGYETQQSLEF